MHGSQKINDLASFLVENLGRIETLKLQKLLYYCNGWSLALRNVPMFRDRTEAWMHGPVVTSIYKSHRTQSSVDRWEDGDPKNLGSEEIAIANTVVKLYGHRSGWALRNLTHNETPWIDAWDRCDQGQIRGEEITREEIRTYFKRLLPSSPKQ